MSVKESYTFNPPQISRSNNMGIVRYCLAIAVFIAHFNIIFGSEFPFPISSYNAVGAFFALSGFLVYPGYIKDRNIKKYIGKRARRILPPYLFIVFLCAFGLVAVSTLPFHSYFSNPQWFKYLISNLIFLNFIEPDLPGVFQHSSNTAVNGSLWTMKIEIMLYLSVPVVAWIMSRLHKGIFQRRPILLLLLIYLASMVYRIIFFSLYSIYEKEIFNILSRQFFGQLMYFYSGVMIYFLYEKMKRKWILWIAIGMMLILLSDLIPYHQFIVGPFAVSLLTLSFSMINGTLQVFNYNNVSYGIYLFHMPVIQVLHTYFAEQPPLVMFGIAFIIVTALASFSWFVIEKRFLPKKFI